MFGFSFFGLMLLLSPFFIGLTKPEDATKENKEFLITVTNTKNEMNITEYIVTINTLQLVEKGTIKPTCEDIMFTLLIDEDENKEIEIPHFLENGCGITNSNFWIKQPTPLNTKNETEFYLSGTPATTKIKVYYGIAKSITSWMQNDNFIIPSAGQCESVLGKSLENNFFLRISNNFESISTDYLEHKHSYQTSTNTLTIPEIVWYGKADSNNFVVDSRSHSHYINSEIITTDAKSTLPPFLNINFCQKKYLVYEENNIPFLSTTHNSTYLEDFEIGNSLFLRSTNYPTFDYKGERGGSATHFHSTISPTYTERGTRGSAGMDGATKEHFLTAHLHYFEGIIHSTNSTSIPKYVSFVTPKIKEGKTVHDPQKLFFSGKLFTIATNIPLAGYIDRTNEYLDRFIRFSSSSQTEIEIGGNNEHNHFISFDGIVTSTYQADGTYAKDADFNTGTTSTGLYYDSAYLHTHTINPTTSKNTENIPSYYGVRLLERKDATNIKTEFEILSTDDNVEGNFLSLIIILSVISGSIVLLLLIVILFLIIVVCICTKKANRFSHIKNVELILKEAELEQMESKETPKLSYDKSSIIIDFKDITLKSVIGQGGSSTSIFLCTWKGQNAVFKQFNLPNFGQTKNDLLFEEFEKEVEVCVNTNHPSILQFYGACVSPPKIGLLIAHCEHGDIFSFLGKYQEKNKKSYPISQKIRLINEICAGMSYLHSRKFVHRDLKPENVLIDGDERSKIMDFGISKKLKERDITMTRMVGTSYYMAPEVIKGGNYSFSCDVYSFSMLMFVIISENCFPFGVGINENWILKNVSTNPNYHPVIDESQFKDCKFLLPIIKKNWGFYPNERNTFIEIQKILQTKSKKK